MLTLSRRIKGIRGFGERWCLWAKESRFETNLLKKSTTLQLTRSRQIFIRSHVHTFTRR
jgi:hypothetical protein